MLYIVAKFNLIFLFSACSPSPCESLTSTTDTLEADNEVFEEKPLKNIIESNEEDTVEEATEEETKKSNSDKNIKEYLQTFERRNSDSKYVMKKTSSLEKINLADEIRKLSDRLLMLSNMKTELGLKDDEINNNDMSSNNNNESPKPPKKPEIKKKPDILTKNSKLNETFNRSVNISESSNSAGSRFMRSSSVINNSSSSSSMESSYTKFSSSFTKKSNSFSEKVNKALDETMKLNGVHRSDSIPISRKSSFSSEFSNNDFGSAQWPVNRRTKFRLTELSRDVPIGSPNTHQNIFMEEAANATKDCLLHLLERYSDRDETATISKGRHQSISVDWGMGISDNMEHRSMNSINAFFHRNSSNVGSSVKKLQSKIEAKNKH